MTQPIRTAEEKWITEEREKVIAYLDLQNCRHAGVEKWPSFHVEPDLALWAVQSINHTGRVGWWAISGDVPTDYMSSTLGEHPRDALRYFSALWAEVADHLQQGKPHPTLDIGTPDQWPALAEMLQRRADALLEFADEDGWED